MPGVRFQRPTFPSAEKIDGYLALAREKRWFSNYGPCVELLTERLEATVGCSCIPVANATVGLLVAVAALKDRAPQQAGEMIVPSFSFAASAQAGVWNGLSPVFVDISSEHWHLDPDALDAALDARGSRVAMVLALSSFGTPPPPQVRRRWEASCARAGVPLLVDSAAGYGAVAADGVPIGAQGTIEVVSFHATKPLSSGEGGAIFCADHDLAAVVMGITNFGFDENRQVTRRDGINAKMSEPTAAIALAALDTFPAELEARRAHAERLLELLPAGFARQPHDALGTRQFVQVVAPDAATRDAVLEAARREDVGLRTYYEPLHEMPAFEQDIRSGSLAATVDIARRSLSLPMAVDLDAEEIAAVADAVRQGTVSRGPAGDPAGALATTQERDRGING